MFWKKKKTINNTFRESKENEQSDLNEHKKQEQTRLKHSHFEND